MFRNIWSWWSWDEQSVIICRIRAINFPISDFHRNPSIFNIERNKLYVNNQLIKFIIFPNLEKRLDLPKEILDRKEGIINHVQWHYEN